jgi:spore germination protein GerM
VRSNNRPRREVAVLFIAFIVCAAVLGALMLKKYEDRRLQPAAPPQSQQEGVFLVTLFFTSPEGTGLVREGREIGACDEPAECVEAVVEELINGPLGDLAPALPAAATIHSVQVDGDLALVDLGEELAEGLPGGSDAEMMAAYSIVNTVAVNFPRIKRVKLLLGGKEVETLKGHLDLREPLAPDFDLEKKP